MNKKKPPAPAQRVEALPATLPAPMTLSARVELIKDILYIIAIAAAGVWAITTFWYQAVYLPNRERPLLTYAATTSVLGEKAGEVAVTVEAVIKNDGKVPQEFWGTVVTAHGVHVVPDEGLDGGWSEAEQTTTSLRAARGYRTVVDPRPLTVEADVVSMPGRRLIVSSHAESTLITLTFFVARGAYDAVSVEVDLLQSISAGQPKADWFRIDTEPSGDVSIQATAACTADPGCRFFHTKFNRMQSLWDKT